jgi:hypothetical protein
MPHSIGFETARFSGLNPNAPSGEEFVRWLAEKLEAHGVGIEGVRTKHGGVEFNATHSGGKYSASVKNSGETWTITIDKRRGLTEQLFGKGQLSPTDPFLWLIENALQGEPDIRNVRRS